MLNAKGKEVLSVVAAAHGMTCGKMLERDRTKQLAHARFEAMYLAREMTGYSYPQIGRLFGNLDHTSILYGVRYIAKRVTEDEAMAARLDLCRAAIRDLVQTRADALTIAAGASTEWSPPPPDRAFAAVDRASWQAIGGEMEAAA